eukprot:6189695-Pleurochrysis_carterae.AAC.1
MENEKGDDCARLKLLKVSDLIQIGGSGGGGNRRRERAHKELGGRNISGEANRTTGRETESKQASKIGGGEVLSQALTGTHRNSLQQKHQSPCTHVSRAHNRP